MGAALADTVGHGVLTWACRAASAMTFGQRLQRGRGWSTPWVALALICQCAYAPADRVLLRPHLQLVRLPAVHSPEARRLLTAFIVWHPLWHWLALAATVATLLPLLKSGSARWVARGYVAAMVVLGLVLTFRPVLPSVENDGLGLKLAALFLIPPFWLAICDHLCDCRKGGA